MDDCIFCKIARKEIQAEIVYEDDSFISFVDTKPSNFGHTLIIPKEHSTNIYTMSDEVLQKLGPMIKKMANAVKASVNAEGVNVIMNNEPAAGQVVFHQHTHIVPRYKNDGHKWWGTLEYKDSEQIKKIGENIRKSINNYK